MGDGLTAQPTIETILTRLNEFASRVTAELSDIRAALENLRQGQEGLRQGQENLSRRIDVLQKGQEQLRKEQEQLRADLNSGLHRLRRKIEILNDNILTVQADLRELEVRLEKLEPESLATN